MDLTLYSTFTKAERTGVSSASNRILIPFPSMFLSLLSEPNTLGNDFYTLIVVLLHIFITVFVYMRLGRHTLPFVFSFCDYTPMFQRHFQIRLILVINNASVLGFALYPALLILSRINRAVCSYAFEAIGSALICGYNSTTPSR